MAITNAKKSKHWLDPSSPKAKKLLAQFDLEAMEPKAIADWKRSRGLHPPKSPPSRRDENSSSTNT